MALLTKNTLGGGISNRLVVGVYGAGPSGFGYVNYDLKKIVNLMGGQMYNHGAQDLIYNVIKKNQKVEIEI